MKKKQKKYSSDIEMEAMFERAKLQASYMKSMQETVDINDILF